MGKQVGAVQSMIWEKKPSLKPIRRLNIKLEKKWINVESSC